MKGATPGHQRLASQHLAAPLAKTALDVVRSLGAMQAQDYGQSLWAIGSRLRGATAGEVTAAIEEGAILRTWPQRGTLHFVPARDAAWMLQISAARMVAAQKTRLAQLELDEALLIRCHGLLERALGGRKQVPRPQLMQLLEDEGIATGGQRGYTVLWHAAHAGLICVGPMAGRQQTFVLLAEWVADPVSLTREQALTELARRYFTGHGPATVHDFAWWSGIRVTEAREAVALAGADLRQQDIDGIGHWIAPRPARVGGPDARLLAGFDEYLLGYQDRTAVLPPQHSNKVVPGGNGIFKPTMVIDGQVVGTWKRTVKGSSVSVLLEPFEEFDGHDAFTADAERYAHFIGAALTSVTTAVPGVAS